MQQYKIIPGSFGLNKYIHTTEDLPEPAKKLRDKLNHCKTIRHDKVTWSKIQNIVGISRATYFRINKQVKLVGIRAFIAKSKKPHNLRKSKIPQFVIDRILKLRRENPTYGKLKIVVILRRDYAIHISESTVGRILGNLINAGQIIRYHKARRSKKKRRFAHHELRWKYGMKAISPGEMVQIDHMSVSKNQIYFKHFQAWDPITKTIVAEATSSAKSITAAKFLRKVIKDLPFKLRSIQVDGGSEFMKDFETECEKLKIPLYVLPPKRPQFNGGVERGNRIFRDDFYNRKDLLADSIGNMKYELQKAVKKYNSYRPHFNLNGMTSL